MELRGRRLQLGQRRHDVVVVVAEDRVDALLVVELGPGVEIMPDLGEQLVELRHAGLEIFDETEDAVFFDALARALEDIDVSDETEFDELGADFLVVEAVERDRVGQVIGVDESDDLAGQVIDVLELLAQAADVVEHGRAGVAGDDPESRSLESGRGRREQRHSDGQAGRNGHDVGLLHGLHPHFLRRKCPRLATLTH